MRKKVISAVLAMIMLFSVAVTASFSVSAATFPAYDSTKPSIVIGTANYKGQGDVLVPISIENNPGLWGANFQVAYDSNLTYVEPDGSVNDGCDVLTGSCLVTNDATAKVLTVYIEDTGLESVTGNGTLLNLKFTPAAYTVGKSYEVKFTELSGTEGRFEFINGDAQDVSLTFKNGAVNCVSSDTPDPTSGSQNNTNPSNTNGQNPTVAPTQGTTVSVPTTAKPAVIMSTSAKPTTKLAKGKKLITVKISKKVANAQGYQIQYSTNKKFKKAKTKTLSAKKASLKIKKLKAKTKYYVRVRAYSTVNGQKVYSKWSKTLNTKTK